MDMNEALVEAVRAAAVERDGQKILACPAAFRIAEKFAIKVREVGDCCNAEKIKIAHCQLGCFK
ncbi:MAG: hypothetical protein KAH38_05595 [Candidatus Hydrogenedentes bacterium]|nr:hypothetical protein [Candidatus Hydrogenedentota bacterium]